MPIALSGANLLAERWMSKWFYAYNENIERKKKTIS
jgi:hypothetical protein